MKLVFIAILFTCGFPVSSWGEPQKRAPSVAQCRSDAATWNKEEGTGSKDKDVGYQLPFGELLKRQREMMDCMRLDAQHGQDGAVVGVKTSYRTIYHVYTTAMYARYQHFLERNQLMEKFLDEDSKGSR
jgi:hypothetical protein